VRLQLFPGCPGCEFRKNKTQGRIYEFATRKPLRLVAFATGNRPVRQARQSIDSAALISARRVGMWAAIAGGDKLS